MGCGASSTEQAEAVGALAVEKAKAAGAMAAEQAEAVRALAAEQAEATRLHLTREGMLGSKRQHSQLRRDLLDQMESKDGDDDKIDEPVFDAKGAWELADVNNDGVLTQRELKAALKGHKKIQKLLMGNSNSSKQLTSLFNTIDRDDSGSIERDEFLAYMDAKDQRDELRQAVLHNNIEMLHELVEIDGCDLHADLAGETALTLAVQAKIRGTKGKLSSSDRDGQHKKLIKTLLDLKADPHFANTAGLTPLLVAAKANKVAHLR